jgi:hypothetical protein
MNPPEVIALGERYGRLRVVARLPAKNRQRYYLCHCECGNELPVRGRHLRSGNTKSCGCLKREVASQNAKNGARRGGASTHPLYHAWHAMIARCYRPHHPMFRHYGARGITVCDRWRDDPFAFYQDMDTRPKGTSLDRIDNDGPYSPENCRWATRHIQRVNQRRRARQLSPGNEDAFYADYLSGLTYRELAERYDKTVSSVSSLLRRLCHAKGRRTKPLP